MKEQSINFAKKNIAFSKFNKNLLIEASSLVEAQGLSFDFDFDDLIGLFENGHLIACGARLGYVFKMLTIRNEYHGSDVLGELLTKLIHSASVAGYDTVFVFTAPQNISSFTSLNFQLLVMHEHVALLEYGPGIKQYLHSYKNLVINGNNGAIVLNGNPFTFGHKYLIEYAAKHVDHLYVFIVREDRSIFPFKVRFNMAVQATSDIYNVTILDTSRYAVSIGTFPSYFLKKLDELAKHQMHIDVHLFAKYIMPYFNIKCRFVGQEPICDTTATYNQVIDDVFKIYGMKFIEIPRIIVNDLPISATRVRRAFINNDIDTLRMLVPLTTLNFLQSPSAVNIAKQLKKSMEEV